MYCNRCGKQIPDGTKYCSFCGAPVMQPPTGGAGQGRGFSPTPTPTPNPTPTPWGNQPRPGGQTPYQGNRSYGKGQGGWSPTKPAGSLDWLTLNKVIAIVSAFLLLLFFALPFAGVAWEKYTVTSFLRESDLGIVVAPYVIFHIIFVAVFLILQLLGKPKISTVGCVFNWILLLIWVIVLLEINSHAVFYRLHFCAGFYVMLLGLIGEIVSIALKPRPITSLVHH